MSETRVTPARVLRLVTGPTASRQPHIGGVLPFTIKISSLGCFEAKGWWEGAQKIGPAMSLLAIERNGCNREEAVGPLTLYKIPGVIRTKENQLPEQLLI